MKYNGAIQDEHFRADSELSARLEEFVKMAGEALASFWAAKRKGRGQDSNPFPFQGLISLFMVTITTLVVTKGKAVRSDAGH